jgi:polyisoprenoid-binding protein YceI
VNALRSTSSLLLLAFLLASPAARAAEQLRIGGDHGTIDFAIGNSKVFRTVGSFKSWRGKLNVDDADVPRSSVEVVIDTGSIRMLDNEQTAILRDRDYFDVDRFPRMTFRSTRVARTGESSLRVEGDVTLRGITRPMTLDMTVSGRRPGAPAGARYANFRGVASLKRSDFGMTKYVDTVGDTVEITITAEAWR